MIIGSSAIVIRRNKAAWYDSRDRAIASALVSPRGSTTVR